MTKLLAAFLAILLTLPAAILAQDARRAVIDELVSAYVGTQSPGLGVLVMRDGTVLHRRGYGLADIVSKKPVDADSLFDLASLSKEMTALAAMLQIQHGLYDQETPISDLLPVFAETEFKGREVTVGDLVHHLGGLPDSLSGDEALNFGPETTNAQVLDWLAQQPQSHAAGKHFEYSNSGYVTLGSLAADDADTLSEALHARIWDELGMDSTSIVQPVDPSRLRGAGQRWNLGSWLKYDRRRKHPLKSCRPPLATNVAITRSGWARKPSLLQTVCMPISRPPCTTFLSSPPGLGTSAVGNPSRTGGRSP